MSFSIFNQQRHQADGTQNAATSPMPQRCESCYGDSSSHQPIDK